MFAWAPWNNVWMKGERSKRVATLSQYPSATTASAYVADQTPNAPLEVWPERSRTVVDQAGLWE